MLKDTAIFDFDKTLIHQGSLLPILISLAGRRRVLTAAIETFFQPTPERPETSWRLSESMRRGLLSRLLRGLTAQDIMNAAERVFPSLHWNETLLDRYRWHHDCGHRIVIATGGLSLYMGTLLNRQGLSPDGLLATELTIQNGQLTGEMNGPACVGTEKARRVRDWMGITRGECWAYGNLPKDGPMLALADHPYNVRNGRMTTAYTAQNDTSERALKR